MSSTARGREPVAAGRRAASMLAAARRPAALHQPRPWGHPVNESTTLTNRERRENVAFLGQAFAAAQTPPAEVLDAEQRDRFAADEPETEPAVLHAALLRRARGPAGAGGGRRRRLAPARRRRRRRRPVRRRVRPHALRARPSGVAQRQQGQDHRLRAARRVTRHLEPSAAAAAPIRTSPSTCCTRPRAARSSRAPSGPSARCGATASGTTRPWTASPASPTGACASAPCAWASSTCRRRPTPSPT